MSRSLDVFISRFLNLTGYRPFDDELYMDDADDERLPLMLTGLPVHDTDLNDGVVNIEGDVEPPFESINPSQLTSIQIDDNDYDLDIPNLDQIFGPNFGNDFEDDDHHHLFDLNDYNPIDIDGFSMFHTAPTSPIEDKDNRNIDPTFTNPTTFYEISFFDHQNQVPPNSPIMFSSSSSGTKDVSTQTDFFNTSFPNFEELSKWKESKIRQENRRNSIKKYTEKIKQTTKTTVTDKGDDDDIAKGKVQLKITDLDEIEKIRIKKEKKSTYDRERRRRRLAREAEEKEAATAAVAVAAVADSHHNEEDEAEDSDLYGPG